MKRRIGIVTPWYGADAVGGAETVARELAARLAEEHTVTVLTTTARAFLADWDVGYYPPGLEQAPTYEVKRFPVDARDASAFNALNARLLGLSPAAWPDIPLIDEPTDAFIDESINSLALEAYLREDAVRHHDALIFLPYLYGVVVRGIEAYPGPAHLLPCLHDEAYARLPRIRAAFHRATTLLMNSAGEAELALRLYGPGILHKMSVIGLGIETESSSEVAPPDAVAPYVVYVGRRDRTKNVDFLVDTFRRYRRNANGHALSLVLAGPGDGSYDDRDNGVVDLGFVDPGVKGALIAGAVGLAQPSVNESYSRVIMEAWGKQKPVAVHAACLATAMAVDACRGGLSAASAEEWLDVFETFERGPSEELAAMGIRGQRYAQQFADWSHVVPTLLRAIFGRRPAPPNGKRIDQFVQTLEFGDAISDYALHVRHRLHELGYASDIVAEGMGPLVADEAIEFAPGAFAQTDALIYHHSIASKATRAIVGFPGPKTLVYHNITPAKFFEPYVPAFAELLAGGRAATGPLLAHFDRLVADSDFNADELRELTTKPVRTIPVVVDFRRFDCLPDPGVLAARAEVVSVLFVGRVSPSKGIARLIDAFEAYLCANPSAHLTIVGRYDPADRYYQELEMTLLMRRMERAVTFAGLVDEAQLTAYYASADIFVSLSEHEGFCVPLVEAMFFDVPILALGATAVPETLGEAGVMIDARTPIEEIGALMRLLGEDPELRAQVIAAQRRRRSFYLPDVGERRLDAMIAELV
uniref:GDP-mannose:cellobiosyl-diphosphopolyprenol alpha-mannosyltransferase n=1 Tax=uncultured organism TaxID=155900 RepID=A0A7L9QC09_9ZZZZ|nr:GDP-mannose:cellobiosyl-diphosphopolyprenol alpha-mannosyltransferase [uncultured organism]